MYWDHLAHYQTALADLEALLGVDIGPRRPIRLLNNIRQATNHQL